MMLAQKKSGSRGRVLDCICKYLYPVRPVRPEITTLFSVAVCRRNALMLKGLWVVCDK